MIISLNLANVLALAIERLRFLLMYYFFENTLYALTFVH